MSKQNREELISRYREGPDDLCHPPPPTRCGRQSQITGYDPDVFAARLREMGVSSIDTWLEVYAAHCHDHVNRYGGPQRRLVNGPF